MYEGVIDDQGRTDKKCSLSDCVPTLRSETHGNFPKVVQSLEIPVRQATSKGYAIARGGVMRSTSRTRKANSEEGESG